MTIAGASAQGSAWAVTPDAVLEGCDVDLVGVPSRLAATDRRAARALAALLRYAPPASSEPRVQVRVVRGPPPVPPLVSAPLGPDIETWRPQPGVLVIRHRRGGSVARATADEIVIGNDAPAFVTTFRHVVVLALAHVLAQHGRQVVHAGAIAVDGRAVLVLGGTGAGKSTLALGAFCRARLDRLDGPERLRLVLGSCLAMGDPAVLREVFTLSAAVARRPGMALQHSRDPRTRLDDGMRVLEEACDKIGLAD